MTKEQEEQKVKLLYEQAARELAAVRMQQANIMMRYIQFTKKERLIMYSKMLISYIVLSTTMTIITTFLFRLSFFYKLLMISLGIASGYHLTSSGILFGHRCYDCRNKNRKGIMIRKVISSIFAFAGTEDIFICKNCIPNYPDIFEEDSFGYIESELGLIESIKPVRFKKELEAIRILI